MLETIDTDFTELRQKFSKRGIALLHSRETDGTTRLTVTNGSFYRELDDLNEARDLLIQLGGERDYHH